MSQENLELLRRGYQAFTSGDLSKVRAILADDVDWGTAASFPGLDPSYRGPAGLNAWMDYVRSAWESFEVTVDDVLRDDGDLVVVSERLRGRGRGSGAEVDMRIFSVYWFAAGKILKRRGFTDEADALDRADRKPGWD